MGYRLGWVLGQGAVLWWVTACSSPPPPAEYPVSPAPTIAAPAPAAVAPPAESATPVNIQALATHLIQAAAGHDFAGASRDFNAQMSAAMPPPKFAAVWQRLEEQVGHFQALGKLETKPEQGFQSVYAGAHFERSDLTVKVVFDSTSHVTGLFFLPPSSAWLPPNYADPSRFEESAVSVGTDPALPGTLTLPRGHAPFAAVVLVHGSGPNDEDESVGAVKVFKDLAWGLASQNIAVLRYVKRTRQAPEGVLTQKEEVLDGAHAAIELLRKTPSVDPRRIFVLGHSQGGALAPRIAKQNPSVAGIVVLAGPALRLQDSLLAQLRYFAALGDQTPELAALIERAQTFKHTAEDPNLKADQEVPLPTGGALTGAYLLDDRTYDAVQVARQLSCRVLLLHGDRDYQVSSAEYRSWVTALSGRKSVAFESYPALNHLFVAGSGPSTPQEYQQPGHVDEAVLNDIAHWVQGKALGART